MADWWTDWPPFSRRKNQTSHFLISSLPYIWWWCGMMVIRDDSVSEKRKIRKKVHPVIYLLHLGVFLGKKIITQPPTPLSPPLLFFFLRNLSFLLKLMILWSIIDIRICEDHPMLQLLYSLERKILLQHGETVSARIHMSSQNASQPPACPALLLLFVPPPYHPVVGWSGCPLELKRIILSMVFDCNGAFIILCI